MKYLIINGPNLNMLGKRDKAHYGTFTLADVESEMNKTAAELGVEVDFFQSNHEGDLIDIIQTAGEKYSGIVINPGALTHYSYALRDAIEVCGIPVIEVHISDIHSREDWRQVSVTEPACIGQIAGLGLRSYVEGLKKIIERCESIG